MAAAGRPPHAVAMAALGILLSIAGGLVGYARADVSLIVAAVVLGVASSYRQRAARQR